MSDARRGLRSGDRRDRGRDGGRPRVRAPTRRELLLAASQGFGALALSALWPAAARADGVDAPGGVLPAGTGALRPPHAHHAPRARNVILLYMDGGPSQVDTFDPKPRLERENGRPIGIDVPATQFDDVGAVLASPWAFRRHGECGHEISALFPHVAGVADELAIVRSMTSRFPEHTFANYFLHTGSGLQGRPSLGSWVTYGLGSDNDDLPGYVVLDGGLIPPGGLDNFLSGFLPASFQGSVVRPSRAEPVPNLAPADGDAARAAARAALLRRLGGSGGGPDGAAGRRASAARAAADPVDAAIQAAVANRELAFRMQRAVPGLLDLSGESAATRRLYGLDSAYPHTRTYATQCLLARRLVERGVRFVELTCPDCGHDRWDQHGNLRAGHADNARAVDQPIAGLLRDLRARGLLDETLVVWTGEFGRTPVAQGTDGRDHNPHGFSMWLAGGGVRGGALHGATDDYGYHAVDGRVTIHDLHATMLHLLGLDHERLTFRFGGRDIRLTDVHGEVMHGILA